MTKRLALGFAAARAAAEAQGPEQARADWKSYRSQAYGFELRYPPQVSPSEEGPDPNEMRLRRGEEISGTQSPLLNAITFRNRAGLRLLTIEVPDQGNFPVVDPDGTWWLRACGEEGFARIGSQKRSEFAGYPALRVSSIAEVDNPRQERTFYLCANVPWHPLILFYQERLAAPAERILARLRLRRPV